MEALPLPLRFCEGLPPMLRGARDPGFHVVRKAGAFLQGMSRPTMEVKHMDKITKETAVTATSLAVVLGLSSRHILRLRDDGILKQDKQGKYPLADSVQAYLEYSQNNTQGKSKQQPDELDQAKKQADTSLKNKRSSKLDYEMEAAQIDNEVKKLKLEEMKNNLYRAEVVEDMFNAFVYTVRTNLLAMPGRLAVDTHNSASAAECAEIIRKDVYAVLNDLARMEYNGKAFAKRKKEMGFTES